MLLCDAAQVADGKLFVLGGGWSLTGPDPVPSAIALKIDVDWHEAEHVAPLGALPRRRRRAARAWWRRPRGPSPSRCAGSSTWAGPTGPRGIAHRRGAGRQPGPHPAGAGQRYTWRLSIDGESLPDWVARVHHPAPRRAEVADDDLRPALRSLPRGLRARRHLPALAGQDDHRVRRPPLLHDHHEPPPAAHQRVVRRARDGAGQERRGGQPRVLARARHERARRERVVHRQPRGRVAGAPRTRPSTATPSTPRPACSRRCPRSPSPTGASSRSRRRASTSVARRSATSGAS